MISPEGYYEKYLKGKNEKQLLAAIRDLKREMGRLKNTMESPDYGKVAISKSDESTRLWCSRMCLDRAKQALADIGGTYMPSKAERKAALFDAGISAISRVVFSIGGFFVGYEIHTFTVDEEHVHFDADHSFILKPSNFPDKPDYPYDKDAFLDGFRELHIGEWRTNYMNPEILDGVQWELIIEFSDGRKLFKTGGSNAYPYNFDALQKLLGIDLHDDEDAHK